MRILLSNYTTVDGDGWDWDEPLIGPASHLGRHEFDEQMGLSSSDIPDKTLDGFRREWHKLYSTQFPGTTFTKVHESYSSRFDGKPLFPAHDNCRVVYLARNPLDVAGSFAHHENCAIDEIIDRMSYPAAQVLNAETYFDEHMGTWSEHAGSWLEQDKLETLVVRYEDLLEDTVGMFKKVLDFSGLEWDQHKASKAVRASKFGSLQRKEATDRFKGRPTKVENFFRSGKAGQWKQELSPAQARRIISEHRSRMEHLGYL